ncbi:MAG TPA: NADPH-dependent FMN reductase [Polyangia bacterium]|nr:NADPH-dependent FMN reductase [Polyangia bacterium]
MMDDDALAVVAISGSLRAESSNAALLRAAGALAPPGMTITYYAGLDTLPPFNPDLDSEGIAPPAPVAALRATLGAARGFLICSPEYAHGVPGALKNALDWIVSSGEFTDEPVLLLNASAAGGDFAQASLTETLTVMGGRVLDASLVKPFLRKKVGASGELNDPEAARTLSASLQALAAAAAGPP